MQISIRIALILLFITSAGSANAQSVVRHNTDITQNTTWSADSVHVVDNNIVIQQGAKLSLEAGAIIKLKPNVQLGVKGVLESLGTAANKVVFTAYSDDNVGGDSDNNGASAGSREDWRYIYYYDESPDDLNILEHVEVRYARTGIYISNARPTIRNAIIREVKNGIEVHNGNANPLIEGVAFSAFTDYAVYANSRANMQLLNNTVDGGDEGYQGFRFNGSSTGRIEGNTITGVRHFAVDFASGVNAPVLKNNTFTGNGIAMRVPPSALPSAEDGNVFLPNDRTGIWVRGASRSGELRLSVLRDEDSGSEINTYVMDGTTTMNGGSVLTIDPGVVLKFGRDARLVVNGTLKAEGTAELPIGFTAYQDDTLGGDIGLDGDKSSPYAGYWYGIELNGTKDHVIRHAKIRYGGANSTSYANITTGYDKAVLIEDTEIAYSGSYGIRDYYSAVTMNRVDVYGNTDDGIYAIQRIDNDQRSTITDSRIYANGGSGVDAYSSAQVTIENSEVFANAGHGVEARSNATVKAEGNWWGAADGPSGNGPGSGDSISGSVDIDGLLGPDLLTDGTEFVYVDTAGTTRGSLPAPVVSQGSPTTEWSSSGVGHVLFDVNNVVLDYTGLATDKRYRLFNTYYNLDNTDASGGNVYRALDALGNEIHGPITVARDRTNIVAASVPAGSYAAGDLRVDIERVKGLRATLSRQVLIEDTADATAVTAAISSPAANSQLTGGTVTVRGSADRATALIDFGYAIAHSEGSAANEIIWQPVTQKQVSGAWSYTWQLPADGSYLLYSRTMNEAGVSSVSAPGVFVVVDQTAPQAPTQFAATDTPQDAGNSIGLSWQLSANDAAHPSDTTSSKDVAAYRVYRQADGDADFSLLAGDLAAGSASFIDSDVTTGQLYTYRLQAVDTAGNASDSQTSAAIAAIDNTVADALAPEEVTGFAASAGNNSISLRWTPSVDSSKDLIAQRLDISVDGGLSWGTNAPDFNDGNSLSLSPVVNRYLFDDLVNGTSYRFRLRVEDGASPANVSAGVQTAAITPSASAFTLVNSRITQDTVWSTGTYVIEGQVYIDNGVTLDIRPGVVVKAKDAAALIADTGARLLAAGVTFTSFKDDSVAGDTNNDGASVGEPGDWRAVSILGTGSRLTNNTFRYAGATNAAAAIYSRDTNALIQGNQITDGLTQGIRIEAGVAKIIGNTIARNSGTGIGLGNSGLAEVRGNIVTESKNGLWSSSSQSSTVADNTFSNNRDFGIGMSNGYKLNIPTGNTITGNQYAFRLAFSAIPSPEDGNTISGNTRDFVQFYGDERSSSVTFSTSIAKTYVNVDYNVDIKAGSLLQIDAGVIVKMPDNHSINVEGGLVITGSESESVVITSVHDDTVGGDTNLNGNATSPSREQWSNIYIADSSIDFATVLEHVEVRYARTGIYISNARPTIRNAIIREVKNGIEVHNGNANPLIEGVAFSAFTDYAVYANSRANMQLLNNTVDGGDEGYQGFRFNGSSTGRIEGNTITGVRHFAVDFASGVNAPVLKNNTFTGNGIAMRVPPSALPSAEDGNVFLPNDRTGIWVRGASRSGELRLSVLRDEDSGSEINTYVMDGTTTMNGGSVLTIDPGVVLKFGRDARLVVNGTLKAEGTAELPIGFTAYQDDTLGGDIGLDGDKSSPYAGYWYGIELNGTKDHVIRHAKIRYGGANSTSYANITTGYDKAVLIEDTEIAYSGSYGIRDYYSAVTMNRVDVYGNTDDGIYAIQRIDNDQRSTITDSRIYANGGSGVDAYSSAQVTIENSEVFANAGHGVEARSNATVKAEGNWWGAADGPSGNGPGSGDSISGSVDIDGLLGPDLLTDGTEFVYFNAGNTNHRSYGLTLPIVSGTGSQVEWKTNYNPTVLEAGASEGIDISFAALDESQNYSLILAYPNGASETSQPKLFDLNSASQIGSTFYSPSSSLNSVVYRLNSSAIEQGALSLNLRDEAGFRTKFSRLVLIKDKQSDLVPPSITISEPSNGLQMGASLLVRGTYSDNRPLRSPLVTLNITPEQGQATQQRATWVSDGEFSYLWKPTISGKYSISATIIDDAGNPSSPSVVENIDIDLEAPSSFGTFTANSIEGKVRLVWSRNASEGESISVQRSSNTFDFADITSLSSSISSYMDDAVELEQVLYYRLIAKDVSGNETLSGIVGPITVTAEGDVTPPADPQNLSLQFTNSASGSASAYLSWDEGTPAADDLANYVISISKTSSGVNGTNSPAFDNNQTIEVSSAKRSIQIEALEVDQSYTFTLQSKDLAENLSSGTEVTGTPSGNTTEVIQLPSTIEVDTQLGDGTFIAPRTVTVNAGATLTLSSGTILKFADNQSLIVNGRLLANGAVFTSIKDDEHGGDTNGDGPSVGTADDWGHIKLYGDNSQIASSLVRFSNSSQGAIYTEGSGIYISDSTIEFSQGGLYTNDYAVTIHRNIFREMSGTAVYIYDGSGTSIRNNSFENVRNGVYARAGNASEVIENNFKNVSSLGVATSSSSYKLGPIKQNTFLDVFRSYHLPLSEVPIESDGNTIDFEFMEGGEMSFHANDRTRSLSLTDSRLVYRFYEGSHTIKAGKILTIGEGVIGKFYPNTRIYVYGALVAAGTKDKPIVLTSIYDDTAGGDTLNDGPATIPRRGSWQGITFYDSRIEDRNSLEFVDIRYAGFDSGGSLDLSSSAVRANELTISNSDGHGIDSYASRLNISNSTIWGANKDGIRLDRSSSESTVEFTTISDNDGHGIAVLSSGSPTLSNNQIFANALRGITNTTSNQITAVNNWWGDVDGSGPQNASGNPAGTGQDVSDNIIFEPYTIQTPFDFVYTNFSEAGVLGSGSFEQPDVLQGTLSDNWDTSSKRASRTMLFDENLIKLRYQGLDPEKSYKIRLTYFNGDNAEVFQSLSDDSGNLIHESFKMPQTQPAAYEYSLPKALYTSGELTLHSIHDNASTSLRGAITKALLIEDNGKLRPANFEKIIFNDIDGSQDYSLGDTFRLVFSDDIDTSSFDSNSLDLTQLISVDSQTFGDNNLAQASLDQRAINITLSEGFTVSPGQTVVPVGLIDLQGRAVQGQQNLPANDTSAPALTGITWLDQDASTNLTVGDAYVFAFSEKMDVSGITNQGNTANANLRPEGGRIYGSPNSIEWSDDARSVTVFVTEGYSIVGDERVSLNGFVRDVAGNAATGTDYLQGRDQTPPSLIAVSFNDVDGSQTVSLNDTYTFTFNEPMRVNAISDGTTEANANLAADTGATYGDINQVIWSADLREVNITITEGFTLEGNEIITPSAALTDLNNNAAIGSIPLSTADTVAPQIVSVSGSVNSPVPVGAELKIVVQFDSAMDTSIDPLIILTAENDTPVQLDAGGTWSTTRNANDTYSSASVSYDPELRARTFVSVSNGQDIAGNIADAANDAYSYVIQAPAPLIDGFNTPSTITYLSSNALTLSGTRRAGVESSIWYGSIQLAPLGEGTWTSTITLPQGESQLEIFARDSASNPSASSYLIVFVDSLIPVITNVSPAADAQIKSSPESIVVTFNDGATSAGLNLAETDLIVTQGDFIITGDLEIADNALSFTPNVLLVEGSYLVSTNIADKLGNTTTQQTSFTIDRTPPSVPVTINTASVSTVTPFTIEGTKEAGSAVLINNFEVAGNTEQTTWSAPVELVQGVNNFTIQARDVAGNESLTESFSITFDDTAPGQVSVSVNGEGEGTTATIDWSSYNEAENGNDIKQYLVYASLNPYQNISDASLIATLPQGSTSYTATGLQREATYYFAVVAQDSLDNFDPQVLASAVTLSDTQAPANPVGISVESSESSATISWQAPADSDLDGYELEVLGETIALDKLTTSYTASNLQASQSYTATLKAKDASGNISEGVSRELVVLLPNPIISSSEGLNNMIEFAWSTQSEPSLIKNFAVFVSETDFTSVQGMQPRALLAASARTGRVAGLTNSTTYYFAVTAINTAGDQNPAVVAVPQTPNADQQGPALISATFDGQALTDGLSITESGSLQFNLDDEVGISRVELSVQGQTLPLNNANDIYSASINAADYQDGAMPLTLTAYDSLNNQSVFNYALQFALDTPPAPLIENPAGGLTTNDTELVVEGLSEPNANVYLYVTGLQQGNPVIADASGRFLATVKLEEGVNAVAAAAENRAGRGELSADTTVVLDTSIPTAPFGFVATVRDNGEVRLSWQPPAQLAELDTGSQNELSYFVYRSDSLEALTTANAESRLNSAPLTSTSYTDLPLEDGEYWYVVTAINALGTEGSQSDPVSVRVDNTAPVALNISYSAQEQYDEDSDTFGRGTVDVRVRISEALVADPFLTIAPENGVPIAIDLRRAAPTETSADLEGEQVEYLGQLLIDADTQSGVSYAVFSARDLASNRGTTILEGKTLLIDAAGPVVDSLTLAPEHPVRNYEANPQQVSVDFTLSEAVQEGTVPELWYSLSGDADAGRSEVALADIVQLDDKRWRTSFTLPYDAGLQGAETLSFRFNALDALENDSQRIATRSAFQVYQGALPPLDFPFGLSATPRPGGAIALEWNAVAEASGYRIYRRLQGSTDFVAVLDTTAPEVSAIDQTPADGEYEYTVTTLRDRNGQQSESGRGNIVRVIAIAALPETPQAFEVFLLPQGVAAQWQQPESHASSELTYRLYRSSADEITDVSGLTPIIDNIGSLQALDTNPSPAEHAYTVTAVDAAGNESLPASSLYLNFELLPVRDVQVLQSQDSAPVVTWKHDAQSVNAFDIYLGDKETGVKLNSAPLTEQSYTDTGYDGLERRYTIVPIDNQSVEGPARTVLVPAISWALVNDAPIKRGVMNELRYEVQNTTNESLSNLIITTVVNARSHTSLPFQLDAGEAKTIAVVVGGYKDLPIGVSLLSTLQYAPIAGETIRFIQSDDADVADAGLVLGLKTRNATRGSTAEVQFTLENSSDLEIQLVTARNSGQQASNELSFQLLDADQNVLSTDSYIRFTPYGTGGQTNESVSVLTLANRTTVAKIPAGQTLTSDWAAVKIPSSAPDTLRLKMLMDKLHYKLGSSEAVSIDGIEATIPMSVVFTGYTAAISSITPELSFGDEDITIRGQAIERSTSALLPNVPVVMIIESQGFERRFELVSDANGSFEQVFTPLAGEAGVYRVSVLHPDIIEKPENGRFTISRVGVNYSSYTLRSAYNFDQVIDFRLTAAEGTTATNARITFEAEQQPEGMLPEGINVIAQDPISLSSGQVKRFNVTVSGTESATTVGSFNLTLRTDEAGEEILATVPVNYTFSEAKPSVFLSPNFVETGVAQESSVTEKVVLSNRGLTDLINTRVELLDVDGNAPPAWAYLVSNTTSDFIKVGGKKDIVIGIAPGSSVADNVYPFKVRITSDNAPLSEIPVFVSVTQSGIGGTLFKLADIYTATPDNNGQLIQGLKGARIRIQNEQVFTFEETLYTDDFGEAFFQDLPAGSYTFRASAENHQDKTGRFRIKPGVTGTERVFLDYNLVSVQWSVREITIQDRYEIVLNATFETNVPAAVLVSEPVSVTLPEMTPGDVFYGEFKLTNHGLVRADNFTFNMPADDEFFRYEAMAGIPDSIEAKQIISVPYRVVSLKSLAPDADDGTIVSGAGCYSHNANGNYRYDYDCANGDTSSGGGNNSFYTTGNSSNCGTSVSIFGGGSGGGGGGGIFGGGGSGISIVPEDPPSGMPACRPYCPDGECESRQNK